MYMFVFVLMLPKTKTGGKDEPNIVFMRKS